MKEEKYDVIIVGAGHAGVEAALISAKLVKKVLLINLSLNKVATMPCNPSIGGPAKGVIVKEIGALGGMMAQAADANYLQIKLLNFSKGPGVQALRAQIDKISYSQFMINKIKNSKQITFIVGVVDYLIIENNVIKGVKLTNNQNYYAHSVILTTGTYVKPICLRGKSKKYQGPLGEKFISHLSQQLKNLKFKLIRLKTGTPPRLLRDSINFDDENIVEMKGDYLKSSFDFTNKRFLPVNKQISCFLLHSSLKTREIVLKNLHFSPMYNEALAKANGPKYCPSFEDKIVRFEKKLIHQIFLEPESDQLNSIYVQGFSTTMPKNIQIEMIKTLPGCQNAKILRYGYAIEYDAILSEQLKHSLETKLIANLYTAGQINGTSGYEEAACQGLMAGINASLKTLNKKPLILGRNSSYIGVLIDDLVSKRLYEPYRMLTSRAEYRLMIRNDNAEKRLIKIGYDLNLITLQKYQKFLKSEQQKEEILEKLKKIKIHPNSLIAYNLKKLKCSSINQPISIYNLLKRPEVNWTDIKSADKNFQKINFNLINQILIDIKYEGYIKKQENDIKKFLKWEQKKIPPYLNYDLVPNLANEARLKLKKFQPISVGQCKRILGINFSDIQMLLFYIKKKYPLFYKQHIFSHLKNES